MKRLRLIVLALTLLGAVAQAAEETPRPHTYAFDQPAWLATQRVFGIGNAITMLGSACADNEPAQASYVQWTAANHATLEHMTTALATYYRIPLQSAELQHRVAEAMHLRTQLSLYGTALSDACASLPETLALPSMDLALRYQAVLVEVAHPDYLKPKRLPGPVSGQVEHPSEPVETIDDREKPPRSE